MKTHRLLICVSTAALFCVSCVSVLPDPAPADVIYRLEGPRQYVKPLTAAPVIRIDKPTAARELNTASVIVTQNGEVASASGAAWSDLIPPMVQRTLQGVLSGRDTLIGVLPNSGARPVYRVSLNIKRFEAEFDRGSESAPLAVVDYNVVLSNATTRKLISTYDVSKSHRAREVRVSSIVTAQKQANEEAMQDIADWMAQQLINVSARGR